MVPETFINYFIANVGASAALIGLLFVAVTVAPERIFGRERTARGLVLASSAFMALLDAFFVSLTALIPGTNIGYTAAVMALLALFNTLSMGRPLWNERHERSFVQGLALLIGSLSIYLFEIGYGVALVRDARDAHAVQGLAYLLLGAYGVGVARTWMLLGGGHDGLLTLLGLTRPTAETAPHAQPATQTDGGEGAPAPVPAGAMATE